MAVNVVDVAEGEVRVEEGGVRVEEGEEEKRPPAATFAKDIADLARLATFFMHPKAQLTNQLQHRQRKISLQAFENKMALATTPW